MRDLISPLKNKVAFLLFFHSFYETLLITADSQPAGIDILALNKGLLNLVDHRKVSPRSFQKQLFNYGCIVSSKTVVLRLRIMLFLDIQCLSYEECPIFSLKSELFQDLFSVPVSHSPSCFLSFTFCFLFIPFV